MSQVAVEFIGKTANLEAGVKRAADKVRAESGRMSDALAKLGGDLDKTGKVSTDLGGAINTLARAQINAKTEQNELRKAYRAGTVDLEQYRVKQLEVKTALSLAGSQYGQAVAAARRLHAANDGLHTSTGGARQGFQQLGFQVGDFSTQISSGTSVAQAFAQQIGQTVQAVTLMAGTTGKFATFLSGPWGIAATLAVSALAPLIGLLFKGEEAAKKAKDAHIDLSNALERQKASQEELNKAIDDYNQSQAKSTESTRLYAVQAKAAAEADLKRALALRQLLAAELARQQGQFGGILAPQGYQAEQARMEGAIADQQKANQSDILRLQTEINNRALELGEFAGKALDPLEKIRQKYDDIRKIIRDTSKAGFYNGVPNEAVMEEVSRRQRVAEETARAAKSASTHPLSLTPSAVGGFLREAFGGTVTSTTGGKHVDGSYHYAGQAVDFVPKGGVGAITKDDIRAALAGLGVKILELLGPGDKNHSDHYHVAFAKSQTSPEDVATRTARAKEQAQAKAEREREATVRRQQAFADASVGLDGQILDAKRATITDAATLADYAKAEIQNEADRFKQALDAKVALGDLNAADRDILVAKHGILDQLKTQAIDAEEARRKSAEAYSLEVAANDNQLDLLHLQESLATTAKERRDLALRILEIEKGEERRALERQALDTKLNDADREIARRKLAQLDQQYALKSEAVNRQTAGPMEVYLREINKTPEQINEAIENIKVNGLNSLTDGLADAIMGVRSLGDVFRSVANQIVADLLRIQIQKMIAGLIGNVLGGVGGGIGGGAGGSGGGILTGGARASGGPVSAGKTYLVGEQGPEVVRFNSSGFVTPNHMLRSGAGNDNMNVTINVNGRMTDREARETGAQAYRAFRREHVNMMRIAG